jgi:hypothetical protein
MRLDKLTARSRVLKSRKGLLKVAQAVQDEFGSPGVTRLAMSLLTNYRDEKDYVGNFHRYLHNLRTRRGSNDKKFKRPRRRW